MEAMREAWTDERLDDLNHRVDEGFRDMRTEFRAMRLELGGQRSELGGRISDLGGDLGGQIAAQQRMMVQLFGGMFATMVVGFLGTIATIIVRG